ncbi:CHAD domain-containing protein [Planctomycetales bacterium ZRK34]|nr:CHAD domain-containing protein [Planctomycetales bacterium ZRK34]
MGITSSTGRAYAAKVLLRYLAALSSRVHGVRHEEDIEYVHQMRVASRRLRNALDLFAEALPRKMQRRWMRQIRRVTKSLGAARDLDVQMVALDKHLDKLNAPEDRKYQAGAERLRLRLYRQRQAIQPRVVATMDRLEDEAALEKMRESLMAMKVRARLDQTPESGRALRHAANEVIRLRLEQMLAYEPFIHSPQHVEELHAMRIAAKHLRYTMEAYAAVYEDRRKSQIKMVREIQTLLGDIHDTDVWLDFIPEFIDAERERHAEFFGHLRGFSRIQDGLQRLYQDRKAKRDDLHKQFTKLWDRHAEESTWQQLRDSLTDDETADEEPIETDTTSDPVSAGPTAAGQSADGQGSSRRPTHGSDNPESGSDAA